MTETLLPSVVLDRAADLIEPEGAWTQRYFARVEPGGNCIGPRETAAKCWCAFGAILNIVGSAWEAEDRAIPFLRAITREGIDHWNDAPERTQPEVVAALRKAADLARSEGQ